MCLAIRTVVLSFAAMLCLSAPLWAQGDLDQRINKEADSLLATYKHLHEFPELSTQEKETSALIAADLKKSGYEVTDHFGQVCGAGADFLRRRRGPEKRCRPGGLRANRYGRVADYREHGTALRESCEGGARERGRSGGDARVRARLAHDGFSGHGADAGPDERSLERNRRADRPAGGGNRWRRGRDAACRSVHEVP